MVTLFYIAFISTLIAGIYATCDMIRQYKVRNIPSSYFIIYNHYVEQISTDVLYRARFLIAVELHVLQGKYKPRYSCPYIDLIQDSIQYRLTNHFYNL